MKNKYIVFFRKIFLGLFIIAAGFNWLSAQTGSQTLMLTGKVSDSFGNAVCGAEVSVLNGSLGTTTNASGTFELNVLDPKAVIEISHVGYATQQVSKGTGLTIEVTLESDVSNKDLIIPTVYGYSSNNQLTSAVSYISGEELNKTPSMNLAAALVGRLPGLIVTQGNAEPGAESYSFKIRGNGTQNGTDPLILIDGVVSDNLQIINPRDVESVAIYKDAASTVLYGMQGGNGIIAVRTKRGIKGKSLVTVNADYSMQQPLVKPIMVNSEQYALSRNEAYKNDGFGDNYVYTNDQINSFKNGTNRDLYPNNNWYNNFVKPLVQTQRYSLSALGNSKSLTYYSNVAYTHVGGPFEVDQPDYNTNSFMDRFNIRSNIDVKLNDFIKSFLNISGVVQRNSGTNDTNGSIYSSIFNSPPTMYGPLTPEGEVVATPINTDPTYGLLNRSGYQKQTSTQMNAKLGLNIDLSFITKGLSTQASAMFDAMAVSTINANANYEHWIRNSTEFPDSLAFIKQGTQLNTPLALKKGVTYKYRSDFSWLLKYKKHFGLNTIDALAFSRYQYHTLENVQNLSGILPYKRMTYGGSINYSYSNLVFAEAAATYEGSEQFAPGRNYGFFHALSAAYVISNHEFMNDNSTITNLKIRASLGVVGNDDLFGTRFLYLDNISTSGGQFVGGRGVAVSESQQGNPTLTWEKSHKKNLGVDLGLWNQLTIGADVFFEKRNDILVQRADVPSTVGVSTSVLAPANIGTMSNKGFEFQLGYTKTFNKDFSINILAYLDYNKNKVLTSGAVRKEADYAVDDATGYSVGHILGYMIDKSNGNGYFNSEAEIAASGLTYAGRAPRVGDFIYTDYNGDNIIDLKDKVILAEAQLPRFSGGVNVNLKWKQFDATLLFQGITQVHNQYSGMGFYDYVNGGTYFDMHLNAWTPERFANGDKITAPALSNTQSSSNQLNDFYVLNTQYLRLKNLQIGYQLPVHLAKKFNAELVRVYVSGINLLTLDNLGNKDLDPEMSGITKFPPTRTFNIGLNVTF